MARVKRRRSLRGLGGSPEHHTVRAGLSFGESLRAYDRAHRDAGAGKCRQAFNNILIARKQEGEATAHMKEAGAGFMDTYSGSEVAAQAKSRTSAWKTFESSCLVGGGLSGARRRRRK